jgi:ATP-dependent Lhr-like helicase
MFFDELQTGTRLLPVELENAIDELVSTGLANADSFAGMRAMPLPAHKQLSNDKRRRCGAGPTMEEAGRWALVRRGGAEAASGAGTSEKPARKPRIDAGFSGEQFALPAAIPLLREVRWRPHDGNLVCISGADPFNLCGTLDGTRHAFRAPIAQT